MRHIKIKTSRYAAKSHNEKERGFLLVSLLVAVFLIVAVGVAASQLALGNYRTSSTQFSQTNVQLAADAGIDLAIDELNDALSEPGDWSGTGGEKVLMNNDGIKTTYEGVVSAGEDDDHKIITITARVYRPADSTEPDAVRKYEVVMRAVRGESSGYGDGASVVTGVGGLIMKNNSKIVGGDVYVNGFIELQNNSQIGLTDNPLTVSVAHTSCPEPPDATYPRVCNAGENGQPISLSGNAHIYGEVKATNQTDGSDMSNPGLVAGTVDPAPLPSHDRAAQKAAVAETKSPSDAECDFPFNNTASWSANLKITGDVDVSNNCEITVHGDVWITGDLELSNSSEIKAAEGLSEPPVIMIDGDDGFSASNGSDLVSNSGDVGFRVITYWSEAGCSPDCTDVTGVDLYDSRDTNTIEMTNSSSGPNTEFYARWSAVRISNAGSIGAVVGQTVKLVNSSAITFGTSVSGGGGSGTENPIAAWVQESYKRVFD